jgi:hypothetical protein
MTTTMKNCSLQTLMRSWLSLTPWDTWPDPAALMMQH